MTRFQQTIPLAIALLLSLFSSVGQAQLEPTVPSNSADTISPIIFNNPPPPPSTGQPGRRSDAGSRGCAGDEPASTDLTSLLALVPTQEVAGSTVVFGKTAAAHPTFWFYVPQGSSLTATFVLQDQEGNSLYESDVALPQTAGVVSVTLPTTVPSLETGKLYHWFFKLYCRATSPPVQFVDGWIQRESLPSVLTQQLQGATLEEQIQLYAANGFWFDALITAAELHQPNSRASAWTDLIRAIGLEDVVGEAIVIP